MNCIQNKQLEFLFFIQVLLLLNKSTSLVQNYLAATNICLLASAVTVLFLRNSNS